MYQDILTKMCVKAQEFSNHIKNLNTLNDSVVERTNQLLTALSEFKGTKNTKVCSICYTRTPTIAFIPCGHTHCSDCTTRGVNRNRCFICRSPIEGTLRIFS